ncbi:E3 ubiquitin-protein ligase DTX3L [Salvelinus fontinalis]|uniref:E3 ubiquitin-protein ligase DTX3L n=1 Tax=Salvelinus fontinalis TaxID=8038 RepID=UPI002484EFA1|nr:E3 ubiquitin-protein ligase DTX3L [Salvelinus fontinalis]
MANASSKEVFSDVTLTVDPNTFIEPNQVKYILTECGNRVTGTLHYEVQGSFDEIEDLFVKMSSLDRYVAAPNLRDSPLRHQQRPRSPTSVKPVPIVGVVWDFIQQRCSEELKRIQGEDVLIHKPGDKMVVTFQSHRKDPVRVHFARERFVTFYQRLATDLKVKTYRLDPQHYKSLQGQFPELLIEGSPSKDNITVTGRYIHIVLLEDFLRHSSSSAVTSQRPLTPQRVSDRASGTTRNKQSDEEEESCPICLYPIKENTKKTLKCKHSFCRGCLEQAFKTKPVCPTCGAVYGELKGTQPNGGTMTVTKERSCLSGYETYGTIVIQYHIPSGIQTEEHPNPGQTYRGASRTAYLPDSSEGRNVLALLTRAFDQRLTFTIGRSSTTGMENMVTWNDIHHKTSRSGGTSCYGYPDPDYLRRLQDELKVKGIY